MPSSASMAWSISAWSHWRVSSTPSTASPFSSSQDSASHGVLAPGSTFSASWTISACSRWNSDQP